MGRGGESCRRWPRAVLKIYSEINNISDNEELYTFSSSSEESDKKQCKCKQINMIKLPKQKNISQDSKTLLFDMIQQIPDSEQQKEYLEKLKSLLIAEEETRKEPVKPFSLKKIDGNLSCAISRNKTY